MNKSISTAALPKGILKSDLEYKHPYDASEAVYKKWCVDNALVSAADGPRELTLYETERFGWIITTLLIGSGRSRGTTDRSYGITLAGQPVRVGMGPHVKRVLTVYLRKSRLADLQQYIDLYNTGLIKAHETRDTISTRRATGTLRRHYF